MVFFSGLARFAAPKLGLILAAFLVSACQAEDFTWSEAVTLKAATPEGQVTATSVREVHARYFGQLFATGTEVERRSDGGPVILDLGGGKVIFGIATKPLAERMWRDLGSRHRVYQALVSSPPREPRAIVFSEPTGVPNMVLVYFRDLSDPQSAVRVDPEDFAAILGDGYALIEANVAVVDAQTPMTPGRVHDYLPWLSEYDGLIAVDLVRYKGFYGDALINGYLR